MGLGFEHTSLMCKVKNGEGNEAGTQVIYDHAAGKFDMKLALKLVQHDHLLGMLLHNTGNVNAFIRWDMHHQCNHTCKAELGTEFHLCDVAKGKMSNFSISFRMNMAY